MSIKKAKLIFKHNSFSILEEGDYVICAISGKKIFLDKLYLFTLAESLGGVESLIEHPAIMTHGSIHPQKREELGILDNFVRISVGIEDIDDLIDDLNSAFKGME